MRFRQIFSQGRPAFSFEFFPPKETAGLAATKNLVMELGSLDPDFVTVTYGAAGGARALSLDLVRFVLKETRLKVCPHLTCVGHSKSELLKLAMEFENAGVEQVLALRGDAPAGKPGFEVHPDGLSCARDLTRALRDETSLAVAVAGYPEVHREAASKAADLLYLKEKVDAGAELIITQVFFDEKIYFDFVEDAANAGIEVPILPGIMPIASIQQLEKFTKLCDASIPARIRSRLAEFGDNSEDIKKFGIEESIRLGQALLSGGAPGIHLSNKSAQARPVAEALASIGRSRTAVAYAPIER